MGQIPLGPPAHTLRIMQHYPTHSEQPGSNQEQAPAKTEVIVRDLPQNNLYPSKMLRAWKIKKDTNKLSQIKGN
jgi:hypothetical protein